MKYEVKNIQAAVYNGGSMVYGVNYNIVEKWQVSMMKLRNVKSLFMSKIWLKPSKAAEKTFITWSCFVLNTEQWYWTVTVQYLCRVKKSSMTIMFCLYTLPLVRPAQAQIQMLTASR